MADELDSRAAGARRLNDKVCIVTGAGQGIGRATAKRLGQEGGTIVVAASWPDSSALVLSWRGMGTVVPTMSWPTLCRPSTSLWLFKHRQSWMAGTTPAMTREKPAPLC